MPSGGQTTSAQAMCMVLTQALQRSHSIVDLIQSQVLPLHDPQALILLQASIPHHNPKLEPDSLKLTHTQVLHGLSETHATK